jgi:hypothetical protein
MVLAAKANDDDDDLEETATSEELCDPGDVECVAKELKDPFVDALLDEV